MRDLTHLPSVTVAVSVWRPASAHVKVVVAAPGAAKVPPPEVLHEYVRVSAAFGSTPDAETLI
jgi:hypothetical protein